MTLPDESTLAQTLASLVASEVMDAPAGLDPDSDLYAAGLDSMGIMRIVMLVEDRWGVTLPDEVMTRETFATTRTLARQVCERSRPAA